ncbi:hypothetical protein HZB08_02695 [Candidatus Saganbacteria bacterium]|uniref:Apolipoprotein N-acyltransferase N-terminal domain-containing protein n=1 Tax=Candidatus Saganbacteria bacterium TaxID=2575572 RepID=A0A9D6UPE8_UNCSA|nr:hypothetical protein [Candidatus Saganbacteria bacterium]
MNILLSVFSGVLLALAFPKFNLWWLAWAAMAPFFWSLFQAKNWKDALLAGLSFGVFFFGIHLFWATSLFRFAG